MKAPNGLYGARKDNFRLKLHLARAAAERVPAHAAVHAAAAHVLLPSIRHRQMYLLSLISCTALCLSFIVKLGSIVLGLLTGFSLILFSSSTGSLALS